MKKSTTFGEPLVSQLGQGWTFNIGGLSRPAGYHARALSPDTSNYKSSIASAGGEKKSPANMNLTISHNTGKSPLAVSLADERKSLVNTVRNSLYSGFVFDNWPYYDTTSGHQVSTVIPNKLWSIQFENLSIKAVTKRGCSLTLLKNLIQFF